MSSEFPGTSSMFCENTKLKSIEKNESKLNENIMSLDDDIQEEITLVSKDGVEFKVVKKYATGNFELSSTGSTSSSSTDSTSSGPVNKISVLIATALEDAGCNRLDLNVESHILKLIVNYMNYKKGNPGKIVPRPLKSTFSKSVDEEDYKFISEVVKNKKNFHDLINAANYLDMEQLISLACSRVAYSLKKKTKQEIEQLLDINNTTIVYTE